MRNGSRPNGESRPPPAYWEGEPDEGGELRLEDYLRVVWERRWFLVATLVVALGATAAYTFTRVPLYEATSVVLIDPEQIQVSASEVFDPTGGSRQLKRYYDTQRELLGSKRIAEPVWKEHDLGTRRGWSLRDFVERISVEAVGDTRLFQVAFPSPDPKQAARVTNALVESYQRDTRQRSLGLADEGLHRLRERAKQLRQELDGKAAALEDFKQRHDYVLLDETQSVLSARLETLNRQLAQVQAARMQAQGRLTALQAGAHPAGSSGGYRSSARHSSVSAVLASLQAERESLLVHLKPDHPRVRAIEQRIAAVSSQAMKAVQGQLQAVQAEEKAVLAEIERQTERLFASDQHRNRYELLEQERDTLKDTLGDVTARIQEVELASATEENNTAYVIEPAVPPERPSWPSPQRNLALAGFLGLLAGVGLCFLIDYLDRSVKTKEEVERLLETPALGFVPAVEPPADDAIPLELTALHHARSPLGEAFRSIRTGVTFGLQARAPGDCQRVVVTSAMPSEGKTLVSTNLAISLAQSGKRVLLVNADLRQPRLDALFALEARSQEAGFSYLLAGEQAVDDWDTLTHQVEDLPSLRVLPGGPQPPNPADLLQSERMDAFLAAAAETFDWLVLDCPPMVVADAEILLSHTGQPGLFVVRSYHTPRGLVEQARQKLHSVGADLVGAVINQVDLPRSPTPLGSKYGYGYGYGHSYGYYGHGNGHGGRNGRKEAPPAPTVLPADPPAEETSET